MDLIAAKAVERWTDSEVEAFLSIYSEDGIQGSRKGGNTDVTLYQTISLRLAGMGIYHTPKQCREKIKKLKQDYKKAKEIIQHSGGSNRRTSKWFHSLDSILGRPAHSEAVVTVPTVANVTDATAWDAIPDKVAVTNDLDLDISSSEVSEPPEKKQARVKTTDKWTHGEVQALLSIYAEVEIQRELGTWRRNEQVYQKISLRLAELGIHHSSKNCRDKVKKMKQDYRRIKELENSGDPNKRPSRPRWFDALDAVLSHRYKHAADTNHCETLLLEVMSDDGGSRSSSHNGQESSAEDEHSEAIHLEESGSIGSPGISGCHDPVSPAPCPASPTLSLILPSQVPDQINGKRKRDSDLLEVMREMEKRDSVFQETMQEMEEAHLDIMRQELEQRERYFQMLLAHNVQEAEAREREFALRREEAAEARRQQEAFQEGFLTVLNRLVQVLDKKDSPVPPPLD